ESMKPRLLSSLCVVLLSAALQGQGQGQGQSQGRLPWLATVEGQPIDTRPTEKKDNAPAFPEQTRAPYHATAPFNVTTDIDNIQAQWRLAFLPSGRLVVTERLPGRMRNLPK